MPKKIILDGNEAAAWGGSAGKDRYRSRVPHYPAIRSCRGDGPLLWLTGTLKAGPDGRGGRTQRALGVAGSSTGGSQDLHCFVRSGAGIYV